MAAAFAVCAGVVGWMEIGGLLVAVVALTRWKPMAAIRAGGELEAGAFDHGGEGCALADAAGEFPHLAAVDPEAVGDVAGGLENHSVGGGLDVNLEFSHGLDSPFTSL